MSILKGNTLSLNTDHIVSVKLVKVFYAPKETGKGTCIETKAFYVTTVKNSYIVSLDMENYKLNNYDSIAIEDCIEDHELSKNIAYAYFNIPETTKYSIGDVAIFLGFVEETETGLKISFSD